MTQPNGRDTKRDTNHDAEIKDAHLKRNSIKRIKGIGTVRQTLLRRLLNIRTIYDLANASIEEIETQLREAGQAISHTDIAGWIDQAQELLEALPPDQIEAPIEEVPSASPAFTVHPSPSHSIETPSDLDWEPVQIFTIEVQTRTTPTGQDYRTLVRREASESPTQTWMGQDLQACQEWISQYLEQRIAETPPSDRPGTAQNEDIFVEPTHPPMLEMAPETVAQLTIAQVTAFQPIDASQGMIATPTHRIFAQPMVSHRPFVLEVLLELSGFGAEGLTQQNLAYAIQVMVRDRRTGETTSLEMTQSSSSSPGVCTYRSRLPSMTLSPGIYRLQILATLQNCPVQPGSFKIPLLHVV